MRMYILIFSERRAHIDPLDMGPFLSDAREYTMSFGLPRIELGLQAPHACVLPLYDSPDRAAGNRTRSTRTRSVRTTGILRPAIVVTTLARFRLLGRDPTSRSPPPPAPATSLRLSHPP